MNSVVRKVPWMVVAISSLMLVGLHTGCSQGSGKAKTADEGNTPPPNVPEPVGGGAIEPPPLGNDGWSDFTTYLVASDGSRSLGTPGERSIEGRDTGSKIVFFDASTGDNETGAAYFWDGEKIIDQSGNAANAEGLEYGSDPFSPNLEAIKPFQSLDGNLADGEADARVRVFNYDFGQLAGGFPDWFLFRRGQAHQDFKLRFEGGRSLEEPMVVGAYGPVSDGRATIDPSAESTHPLHLARNGQSPVYCHMVLVGLDIVGGFSATGTNDNDSANPEGDASSAIIEDCEFTKGPAEESRRILFPPRRTVIRRSVLGFSYNPDDHNQAYYTEGPDVEVTMEEVIFYKNGYKSDPRLNADPLRDKFSRNVYQGGGGRMGHVYRGIISADGASGGPQMRYGGLMENSLIVEGYWFSSTNSNSTNNPWTTIQEGQSALVRNNVQLVLDYPSAGDPDPEGSDESAQYGEGYTIQGSSFGAVVEGNIISGAMLVSDLQSDVGLHGISLFPSQDTYPDGQLHTFLDNSIRSNIVYNMGFGFQLGGDWPGVQGVSISDNVFATNGAGRAMGEGPTGPDQLVVENNRFYSDEGLPDAPWVGSGNESFPRAEAASAEGWTNPDRTLRGYVQEVLNLELLDWGDDPYLDPEQAADRQAKGEAYDPTGLKTFMAVAMGMRYGGTTAIPSGGKPTVDADYPWDERFTGPAVVNWIREGFGLPPVE